MSTNERMDSKITSMLFSYNGILFKNKKNELLIYIAIWNNLKSMLGERNKSIFL